MNRTWAIWAISVCAIGIFAGLSTNPDPAVATPPPADKVNLALRRTVHRLLAQSGDSTSAIAPVEQGVPGVWTIRLERPFDYRALADLLQESFEQHGIAANYDVALFDCNDDILLLGYTKSDLTDNNDPTCGTREQTGHCYVLKVSFPPPPPRRAGRWYWALLLAAVPVLYWWLRKKRPAMPPPTPAQAAPATTVSIGRSSFDTANQILMVAGERHHLTYREAKLLHFFSQHPNQLLERDHILQSVWADEGILVGRSVDVFVSRLRKLLRADTSVRLANVHGVGYRLEVD